MEKNIDSGNINPNNNLFVYGTLQHGQSRNAILQGVNYIKAMLENYDKIVPKMLGFPFIIKKAGKRVFGELYFHVPSSIIREIDYIEGEGSLYHRIIVKVEGEDEKSYHAFTYYPDHQLIQKYT